LFACAVYGAVAIVVLRTHLSAARRTAIAVPLLVLPLVIAGARIYLLDHFASDAIASIALGSMWLAVIAVAIGHIGADAAD
jgi:membrane-associated phospholipid phosphatase